MNIKKLYIDSFPIHSYQNLEIAVFIKDLKSQYLWVNEYFVKNSAGLFFSHEVINKTDYDFIWHDYANELQYNDQLVFDTTKALNVNERILIYNGNYLNIISKKTPLFDNDHQLIGLLGISLEIPLCPVAQSLSKREYTIILLMSEGHTDKQIAKKLNISPRTVETHIIKAKRKLNVATRAELIVKVSRAHP